jgi:hypothetical protein
MFFDKIATISAGQSGLTDSLNSNSVFSVSSVKLTLRVVLPLYELLNESYKHSL